MPRKARTPRERMIAATLALLTRGGREAVSTRSVSAAAGVQVPAIYRLFGDMRGLLDAVASHGFAAYLHAKSTRPHDDDPIEDLRGGWDLNVAFGLANPAVYTLMYGEPREGAMPAAAQEALANLRGLVERAAQAGRLRVGVKRATDMIHAAGKGTVFVLLAQPAAERDPAFSAASREAVLAAVTTEAPEQARGAAGPARAAARAVALKAVLDDVAGFSPAERALLADWLDRIAGGTDSTAAAPRR